MSQYGSDPGIAELGPMLLVYGIAFAIGIAIGIVICFMVYKLYEAIPAKHRTMEPGLVWLLLIPLFNLFWNFKVYLGLAESFSNAFAARGEPLNESQSGRTLGLWYAILAACSIIPCLGSITALVALVLLILILVKGFELKRRLESMPEEGEVSSGGDEYEERWPS